jgi:hypothetical protein
MTIRVSAMIHWAQLTLLCAILAFSGIAAHATTESTSVGGGTLSWTVTQSGGTCGEYHNLNYTEYSFSAFSFLFNGTSYPLSAGAVYFNSPGTSQACPPNGPQPSTEPIGLPSNFGNCMIDFSPQNQGYGSATMPCTGYIDLRYLVLGVTYAPPGSTANLSNNWAQYMNSTLVGNTESVVNSFTSSTSSSVSVSAGFSIKAVFSGSITSTTTNTASQTSAYTNTVSTSVQVSNGEKTFGVPGVPNSLQPIDHDYDVIWVWLNPVAIFTVNGNSVTWNGYGYNQADQNGMDIYGIQLGWLNGDFGSIFNSDLAAAVERSWASSEVFPAGESASLNSTDFAAIAAADPFSNSGYADNYIGYDPPAGGTEDGRFTTSACSANASVDYLQGAPSQTPPVVTCTLTYTTLTSQAESYSNTNTQMFSTDSELSATFFKLFTGSLKSTNSITFTTTAQKTITSSTTQTSTASFSLQGPNCGNQTPDQGPCVPVYNGPTQFDVYQDNVYGTFMFAPVHWY